MMGVMPSPGAPVTLYGLISTMYVNRDECVNTHWDPDWQSLVDDGYMKVFDPPIACANAANMGDGEYTIPQALKDYIAANGGGGTVEATDITDSTSTGRSVLTATDAAAARGAIRAVDYARLARNPDALIVGTITRDGNGAAIAGAIEWPDGTPGDFTALVVSMTFPGAIDSYQATYGSPVTKTYTQPLVTRDATGAVTILPAIVES